MATTQASCSEGAACANNRTVDPFEIELELRNAPRPAPGKRSNISEFYRGRNVLITGASGFIGKVLIEKLLRTCPAVGRIYVLVRPKRGKQPSERVRELLESHLFDGVRRASENLEERVIVVEGDVTQVNLGLSSYNLARVTKDVSVIFHSAATVKFDEPLKQSVAINIAGTKNMINLCRRIPHLAGLVHVSTAYANCNIDSVDEHIYPVDMEPEKLIQMADWLDQDTLQELKERLLGPRPNTYTYTKALAEWLLVRSARDLPVVICRPSIVVASSSEPFRGWIDNMNGPTGVVLGTGKGLIRSMYAETECVADLVPVDKVISLVVTLGWFAHNYRQANQTKCLEESLADSLIGSSASSSSAASSGSSSAASTSGDSLVEEQQRRQEMIDRDEETISSSGDLSLTSSNDETASSMTEETSNHPEEEEEEEEDGHHQQQVVQGNLFMSPHDDGYGSRSPHYAGSLASSDSAASSLSRRHRQISDSSSRSSSSRSSGKGNNMQVKPQDQTSETDELTTTTTTTITDTTATTTTTTSSDLTASNLCDIKQQKQQQQQQQQQQPRRRRRRSYGAQLKQQQQQQQMDNNNQNSTKNSELNYKLKQFRQRTRAKLMQKDLPDELADIPVFHCTSGSENPITWGQVQLFIVAALAVFPSTSTYRYPCGSFTNNEPLDNFYRITLHYIPGYIADFVTKLLGGKPVIVRIFRKFDQAANVLKAFTSRQWHFDHDNRLFLMQELMTEEDRRLFDCDIRSLDWRTFCLDYAAGVRKFLLKEPMITLEAARRNLRVVFYRNLSIQLVFFAATVYYMATSIGLLS